jgi:thiamine biosynthesis lipoprotein
VTRRTGPLGIIVLGLVGGGLLASRILPDRDASAWVEREFLAMGTTLTLRIEAPDRAQGIAAIDAAVAAVERVDALLSSWRDDSDVGRLNAAAAGTAVPVAPVLLDLLTRLGVLSAELDGAFDPAIGALIDAWDFRGDGRRPTDDERDAAVEASGFRHLVLDPAAGSATWTHDGAWIDAGGFGKGAALAAVAGALDSLGITRGLVDFGGQILALGPEDDRDAWTIGVADPDDRDRPVARLAIANLSSATSSQSERGIAVDTERVGHILDPRTGQPVPAWGSVTVVGTDPVLVDVLSTALFVLGAEGARRWGAEHADIGVYVLELTPDGLSRSSNTFLEPLLQ